jgi:hypothetical protein
MLYRKMPNLNILMKRKLQKIIYLKTIKNEEENCIDLSCIYFWQKSDMSAVLQYIIVLFDSNRNA